MGRQVAVAPPERQHAPEYEFVQREEASELRRRARAFLLAQATEVASMGFQLFACPECEYQNVYVFVRRDGGL